MNNQTRVFAGLPNINNTLYHRIRFVVGDPTVCIERQTDDGTHRTLILRDIEMGRARRFARADEVACPNDFAPAGGLSGDRETATAQATAECLARSGVTHVRSDRSLPLLFAHVMKQAGIEVECDPELGVIERRSKDTQEIEWLQDVQSLTEQAMLMACETVGQADARADGVLVHEGAPLTSERVKSMIDVWILEHRHTNPGSIVAGGPRSADCHDSGAGELRTGEPIIIDIFPRNPVTRYNGDCTRTVVHGDVPDEVVRMHDAVVEAKRAAIATIRSGATGEEVHQAAIGVIKTNGYSIGLPGPDDPDTRCAMTHGTGHGVGLDVHEPPLLDLGAPALVTGDALTVEPGLYCPAIGGLRIEDMVVVTEDGCMNLNRLQEGLTWA